MHNIFFIEHLESFNDLCEVSEGYFLGKTALLFE
jgi:hypothetical protein